MNIDNKNKLNHLLKYWSTGSLFFSSWLNRNEYSNQLMQKYHKSGWFSSLAKVVMYRTGDKVSTWGAISSYKAQEDIYIYIYIYIYVAAHSSLELFGIQSLYSSGKTIIAN